MAAEVAAGRWVHIFPEGKINYTGTLGPLRWGVGKLVCDARARTDRCGGTRPGAGGGGGGGRPSRPAAEPCLYPAPCTLFPAVPGRDPVVLPFYHSGMGAVLPKRTRRPRTGHDVRVVVGQPVELADLTCRSVGCHCWLAGWLGGWGRGCWVRVRADVLPCCGATQRPGPSQPLPPPPRRCNRAGEDQRQVWRDITHRIGESLRALEARAPRNPDQVLGGPRQHDAERHRQSEGALPAGRPGEEDE